MLGLMKVQGDVPETSQTSGKDVKVFVPPKKNHSRFKQQIPSRWGCFFMFFPAEFVDADLWSRLVYLLVDVGMMFDIFWRRSNGWGWFLGIGSVPLSFICLRCPLLLLWGCYTTENFKRRLPISTETLDGSIHLNIIYKHVILSMDPNLDAKTNRNI